MGKCRIIEINSETPQPHRIGQIADVLKQGGIVAHPTDTTYALGVTMSNKKGVEQLYALKKKTLDRPLSFLCTDISNLAEYAQISNLAFSTMRQVLPGAYTFILPARKTAPKNTWWSKNRKEIGLRVPDDAVVRALIEDIGEPMISTSAKLPDGDLLATAQDVYDYFGHAIDIVVDAGYIEPAPSSIVSFLEEDPVLIRKGKGSLEGVIEIE